MFAEATEGERDIALRKLSLSSDQLAVEREREDMVEASLAVTFACLDKSVVDYIKLYCLLVEARGQREKTLLEPKQRLARLKLGLPR